jgi:preprotein translocase subunit SecY
LILITIYLFINLGVLVIQDSEKKIPIDYNLSKINSSNNNISKSYKLSNETLAFLPLKINSSGVLALIILLIFNRLKNATSNTDQISFLFIYVIMSSFIVFIFNYYFSKQQIKIDKLVKLMKEENITIKKIRFGSETKENLDNYLKATSIIGSGLLTTLFLSLDLINYVTNLEIFNNLNSNLVLIITSVTVDFIRRTYSETSTVRYNLLKI